MEKVSIVMPVYNAAHFLAESISSILQQSFSDFELIIIDDGSSDESVRIIESFRDSRIKFHQNNENRNLVYTLNKGLSLAQGKYILRMDADDIALAHRIQTQVDFMEANPQVGICGSWYEMFDGGSGIGKNPVEHNEIKASLLFFNVIAHPTVIMRRELLDKYNLRYEKYLAEDFDLWQRASFCFELHNIPEVLLRYRIHKGSYSQVNSPAVWQVLNDLVTPHLGILDVSYTSNDLESFKRIAHGIKPLNTSDLKLGLSLCKRFELANRKQQLFPVAEASSVMWQRILLATKQLNLRKLEKIKLLWPEWGLVALIRVLLERQ